MCQEKFLFPIVRFFVLAAVFAGALCAQIAAGRATLVGTVTDSSGAAVPGAKVKVVNAETSFVAETTTDARGDYYIPDLEPGAVNTYKLSIEAAGFKTYIQDGISLQVAGTPRIDATLEVGTLSETVQVTGKAPLLETETSLGGMVLEGVTGENLVVNQKRSVLMLYYYPDAGSVGGYHTDGQRQRAFSYDMDGMNAKEPGMNNVDDTSKALMTAADNYAEVKVETAGLPAEVGHAAGGEMAITFKSGTNELHAHVEDRMILGPMIHRDIMEANRRRPDAPFQYHQSTITAGGPVWIPKVYNGKNRTFWLFGLELGNEHSTWESTTAVPTPAMLTGDFSLPGAPGGPLPIYNPFSTTQLPDGTWTRTPFPGNQVPQSLFDPVVVKFLSYHPWQLPVGATSTMGRSGPTLNVDNVNHIGKLVHRYGWDAKIDEQITPNNHLYGRYSGAHHHSYGGQTVGNDWTTIDPASTIVPTWFANVVVSDTYILSPSLVNEVRVGGNELNNIGVPPTYNQNWAGQLGMPNVSATQFPYFNIGFGISNLGKSITVGRDTTFQDNVTKIKGRHTIKFGYELIRTTYNSNYSSANPSGNYTFGGTELPFTPNTGITFASFLLGTVSSATFTNSFAEWLPRWWSHEAFVQDDWRPFPKLTLNLGVRYSYESPFTTKYGQQSEFSPTAIDPLTGMTGAFLYHPSPLASAQWHNFAPRVGLAYRFAPHAVFRGSFGIVHQDVFAEATNIGYGAYQGTVNIQQAPGNPNYVFRLSQGPPSFQYTVDSNGQLPYIGTNYSARPADWWDPNMRMPYVMTWSGGFEDEIRSNYLLALTYTGQSGVGLVNSWNMNQIPLSVYKTDSQATLNTIYAAQQNYLPYPQFGTIRAFSNYGHNSYHAMTFRVEKRYSKGLTLNAFYTYAKTLDNYDSDGGASGVDFYNQNLEKGRAGYDIAHRFVSLFTWEFPFGRGRRWLRAGAANQILGGWTLAWTQTFQTGAPFSITYSGSPNKELPGGGSARPNILTPTIAGGLTPHWDGVGPNRFPQTAQIPYLQFSSFGYPAAFSVGNLGRDTYEAPGMDWTQFSVSKWWSIHERVRFQVRLDGQNLPFKQPQWGTPNGSYNANSATLFGTEAGPINVFNRIGTGEANWTLVGRFEF